MLPMTETTVTLSKSTVGYNAAINIEFAGIDFDKQLPSQNEIDSGVQLVVNLMKQYNLTVDDIYGHYQIDPSSRQDPSPEFLQLIKTKVEEKMAIQP
jgi:hypothetical protein